MGQVARKLHDLRRAEKPRPLQSSLQQPQLHFYLLSLCKQRTVAAAAPSRPLGDVRAMVKWALQSVLYYVVCLCSGSKLS